ncbi:MAG: DNA internalization-related competence protein ComEC/Rec2 [Magnetococcales bacterium]|nr:DNA internalization-related competence protein ComEC/Rec2 [Magnetococcales bacterium]
MEIDKQPEKISGPALALFCQIAVITLCSPELADGWLPMTGMAWLVAGVSFWLWRSRNTSLFPALFGLLLGVASMAWQQRPLPPFPTALTNQAIFLEGMVVERQDRPDSVQLILDRAVAPAGINPLPAPVPIPGQVQMTLHVQEPITAIPGDWVRIHTHLKPVDSTRNPGGFDYARFQHQQGILAFGSSRKPVERVTPAVEWSWNRYRQTLSQWIADQLPTTERGLVEALMVGKTGFLDEKLTEDLVVSGTFHLVAISGLQVGLVAGWSFFALRLLLVVCLPLSRRWDIKQPVALLTLVPTVAYAFLAGWSISTQRATLMTSFLLLAIAVGRTRQLWRVLTFAAMVLLTYQPWQLFAPGFQLSFLSVIGLMFFMPLFQKGRGWRNHAIGLVMTTVVASAITTPWTAYYFHRLTPHGLLANLLAVPWVSVICTPLGFLAIIAHELYPPLGDWLLHGMGESLEPYRLFIAWIGTLPGAWYRLPGPSLTGLAFWLGLCTLAGLVGMAGMTRWRIVLFLLAWPTLWWPRSAPPADQLHLAILDVGQAQSVVLYTPHGGWSVFDSGGFVSPRFDPGEAFTSSYLWHLGVRHLNRIAVSHPQMDHMAGVERLLRNFQVDSLWLGDFPEAEEHNAVYARLIAQAEKQGVAVQRIRQRVTTTDGDAQITVLPPLPGETRDDNDRSLVIEITYAGQRFLIPGDATARTEQWLLALQAIQPLTVLVAPHHGSKTSSTPAFVRASHPEHVAFSVGLYNSYHHPSPQVLQRWQDAAARIWRTDQQGAILFQSDGEHLHIKVAAEAEGSLWERLGRLF